MKNDKDQRVSEYKHNMDPADKLEEHILQVAVIGRTCAGKTTLINALVGEELLPTAIEVNTGAIVKLVRGNNTDAATLVEQGVSRIVTRKEFRDFIQIPPEPMAAIDIEEPFPLPDRLNKLDYGILPHNNSLTQRGIAIVDTLGVNAGPKAAEVTGQFLTEADAIVVVLGTSPPLSETDVNLIKSQLRGMDTTKKVENMFFIVNAHNDMSLDDKQKIIENILQRRLGALFGDDASLFARRVFFVNAKQALEARLAKASKEVMEETGLTAFERALTEKLVREQLVMAENRSHQQVAKNLRGIAALIGKDGPQVDIEGERIETALNMPTEANLLTETADRLDENILQVAVIGGTCAGKTTFMNALVGEELLPTSLEVNTGAIVKLVHGNDTDDATLIEQGVPRTVTRKEFRDFIQIPPKSMKNVLSEVPFPLSEKLQKLDYGILPHTNEFTQRGIAIVDTLGVNAGPKAAEVTGQFLTEADAIVVVLGVSPPLSETDVNLIKSQLRGMDTTKKVENMFFVVNLRGDISEDDKQQLIEDILPRRLGALFGDDASLFSRRVFFVNAKKALDAQVTNSSDAVLTETGLTAFKDALIAVADSEESRRFIMENTMSKLLLPTLHEVRGQIADNKALLGKTLRLLQVAKQAFEAQATERNKKVEEVLSTLDAAEKEIAEKARERFADYFNSCLADWQKRGEFKTGFRTVFSTKRKEEFTKTILKFFEETLIGWHDDISDHLNPDMTALIKQLEGELTEFLLELDTSQISSDIENDEILNPRERSKRKAVQMVIEALALDRNQIMGTLREDSWIGSFSQAIVQGLRMRVTLNVIAFAQPFFFRSVLDIPEKVAAFLMDTEFSGLPKRQISEQIQGCIPGIQQRISDAIAELFKKSRDLLHQNLQAEIEAVRHQLDTANSEVQGNTDAAKMQLNKIEALFNEKFNAISEVVYGHVLTLEEQKQRIKADEAVPAQSESD